MRPRARNVLAVYDRALPREREQGREWYAVAREQSAEVAREWRVPELTAAGIIAALSPSVRWERNVAYAGVCCEAWRRGDWPRGIAAYPANVEKAFAIYLGGEPERVLRGHKVRAFYALIAAGGDPTGYHVCIDGHAVNLALGRRRGTVTDAPKPKSYRTYLDYVRVYRCAAERAGMLPHQLQAVTWLAWRRLQWSGDQLELDC